MSLLFPSPSRRTTVRMGRRIRNKLTGAYRQRFILTSGRFAMIDDGLGFQLVPWTAALEGKLGQHVSGVARGDGGVDWGFSRKRGLSR
ncbi:DUF3363 domain-containing protein [Streptomyces sporangiiformans]|uniref:DUF3363 domain-containing protein n=1 Tax=Streptomyces sporangiiformans TaxID=2315329 RepID=UPI001969371D|nr:DUF3363 domain-containing protein [Streptomyces sporangiiformans]